MDAMLTIGGRIVRRLGEFGIPDTGQSSWRFCLLDGATIEIPIERNNPHHGKPYLDFDNEVAFDDVVESFGLDLVPVKLTDVWAIRRDSERELMFSFEGDRHTVLTFEKGMTVDDVVSGLRALACTIENDKLLRGRR